MEVRLFHFLTEVRKCLIDPLIPSKVKYGSPLLVMTRSEKIEKKSWFERILQNFLNINRATLGLILVEKFYIRNDTECPKGCYVNDFFKRIV